MGRIRSAWEIALEKTENMEIDQDRIRRNTQLDGIRRLIGQYMSAESKDADAEALKRKLSQSDQALVKEALATAVLNSLTLPQNEDAYRERRDRILGMLPLCFPQADVSSFYTEVTGQLLEYPRHREELIKRLTEQLEPMLRQKEEAMRQKYGESVHLTVENDKESMEAVKSYIDRLNRQYEDTIANAKETLSDLFSRL